MPHSTTWQHIQPSHDAASLVIDRPVCHNRAHSEDNISSDATSRREKLKRRQSQQSALAKFAMATANGKSMEATQSDEVDRLRDQLDKSLPHPVGAPGQVRFDMSADKLRPNATKSSLAAALNGRLPEATGTSFALNDTPATTAPNSPRM